MNPLEIVSRAFSAGRLAHAYLLAGAGEQPRRRTLKKLGALLLCYMPVRSADGKLGSCNHCTSCRKVRHGTHPDLVEIMPQGASIKIEQIRKLQEQVIFAPLESKRRVVLIHSIDKMNLSGANALLKLLEEPPDHTHLLLSSGNISRLLPTIVSRCQVLRQASYGSGQETVDQMAKQIERPASRFLQYLVKELSIRDAEELSDIFAARDHIVEFLCGSHRHLLFLKIGGFLWSSPGRVRHTTLVLGTLLRDLMLLCKGSERAKAPATSSKGPILHNDITHVLCRLAERINYDTLEDYEKRLTMAQTMLERNVKPEMIADMLLVFWLKDHDRTRRD